VLKLSKWWQQPFAQKHAIQISRYGFVLEVGVMAEARLRAPIRGRTFVFEAAAQAAATL
jgi:hypothetical protein